MAIDVQCQDCGKRYKVDDKFAGKKGKCKQCGATFQVPAQVDKVAGGDLSALGDIENSGVPIAPVPTEPRRGQASVGGESAMGESVAGAGGSTSGKKVRSILNPVDADAPVPAMAPKTVRSVQLGYEALGSGRSTPAHRRDDPIGELLHVWLPRVLIFLGYGFWLALAVIGIVASGAPVSLILAYLLLIGLSIGLLVGLVTPLCVLGMRIAATTMDFALVESPGWKAFAAYASIPVVMIGFMLVSIPVLASNVHHFSPQYFFSIVKVWGITAVLLGLAGSFFVMWLLLRTRFRQAMVAWAIGTAGFVVGTMCSWLVLFLATLGIGLLLKASGVVPTIEQASGSPTMPGAVSNPLPAPTLGRVLAGRGNAPYDATARLRTLGQGILFYANDHRGAYPPALEELPKTEDITKDMLVSPYAPDAGTGFTYLHFEEMRTDMPGQIIVAYDPAALKQELATAVLFADGSAPWLSKSAFDAAMAHSDQLKQQYIADRQQVAARPQPIVPPTPSVVIPPRPPVVRNTPPNNPSAMVPVNPGNDTSPQIPQPPRNIVRPPTEIIGPTTSPSPIVADVTLLADAATFDDFVTPATPGNAFAIVRRQGAEDQVDLWKTDTGSPVKKASATIKIGNNAGGASGKYALSPNGQFLARIGTFPSMQTQIWSIEQNQLLNAIDLVARGRVEIVGFAGNDMLLVHVTNGLQFGIEPVTIDQSAKVKPKPFVILSHADRPGVMCISPDGKTFALATRVGLVGNERACVQLYTTGTGAQKRRLPLDRYGEPIVAPAGFAFSPDNSRLAILFEKNSDAFLTIWNLNSAKPPVERIYPTGVFPDEHLHFWESPVTLDWSADGSTLVFDGSLLLDAETGQVLGSLGVSDAKAGRMVGKDVILTMFEPRVNHKELAITKLDASQVVTLQNSLHPPTTKPVH